MPAPDHLLTTREMARFVAQGYLRFDAIVSDEINAAVLDALPGIERSKTAALLTTLADQEPADLAALADHLGVDLARTAHRDQPESLTPLRDCYPDAHPLGQMLRSPQIAGIIRSLVGDDPVFDHDFVHHLRAGQRRQHLHVDAVADTIDPTFDVQLFYFPHDVAPGGGGTRFIPGSHVRRVHASNTAAYQHMAGDQFFSGPAGTVLVFHHGLWHAGTTNESDSSRWMYKIRLNPTQLQQRQWNLDDFDALHNDARDHVFARLRTDSIAAELRWTAPWEGVNGARYNLVERIKLWRYLSGDADFDADYYLTRQESRAQLLR